LTVEPASALPESFGLLSFAGEVGLTLLVPGGIALIADPGRVAAPVFVEACAAHGLAIRLKETKPFEAGEIRQKIDIYEIGGTA